MTTTLVKHSQNGSHKVFIEAQRGFALPIVPTEETPSLLIWAERYMQQKVIGIQAKNTLAAKRLDLRAFLEFFSQLNGHLCIEHWLARDTRAFVKHLEKLGRAPTTIHRMFPTLRHFARWVHEQPGSPFARTGLPTAGLKELSVEEPEPKKLEPRELWALFKAADSLVLTETRKNSRPRRNRAILAVLYYTGLRVTELVHLKLDPFNGKRCCNVKRKGAVRTKVLYLPSEARTQLDDYLERERPLDDDGSGYLFVPCSSPGPMTRRYVHKLLVRIANEATKHQGAIHMHPHRLRHTFGFDVRQRTKSDSETARLLGHQSDKYAGRYARSTQAERETILDTLEVGAE